MATDKSSGVSHYHYLPTTPAVLSIYYGSKLILITIDSGPCIWCFGRMVRSGLRGLMWARHIVICWWTRCSQGYCRRLSLTVACREKMSIPLQTPRVLQTVQESSKGLADIRSDAGGQVMPRTCDWDWVDLASCGMCVCVWCGLWFGAWWKCRDPQTYKNWSNLLSIKYIGLGNA